MPRPHGWPCCQTIPTGATSESGKDRILFQPESLRSAGIFFVCIFYTRLHPCARAVGSPLLQLLKPPGAQTGSSGPVVPGKWPGVPRTSLENLTEWARREEASSPVLDMTAGFWPGRCSPRRRPAQISADRLGQGTRPAARLSCGLRRVPDVSLLGRAEERKEGR